MGKLENKFKTELKKEIKERYPGCMVMHLDPNDIQGIPDLLILHKDKWASLEGKKDKDSPTQPNQPYYVEKMNNMSFSKFIYPENKEKVLNELDKIFID